jgi:ABC-type dipeptide/oligopeptide/nickel transport system permease component
MRTLIYIGRRLLYLVPQALGISIVTFVIVRLLPGNPAIAIAGPRATTGMIQQIQHEMGLDRPLWTQYGIYLGNILRGDFGRSWVTSNAVTTDLAHRVPATLELITIALFLSVVIGIPLGMLAASKRRGGPLRYLTNTYGALAGAVPDFWLGLILIFVFYVQLHWAPSPVGRLDLEVLPPEEVTGLLTVDSLLEGNWEALRSALSHLALPVITLVFIYMAPIVKMTRSSMEEVLRSSHVEYGEALGLPPNRVMLRALRNAAPPVVTIFGVLYGYLLGGAVLVESVFSWGGVGQYAVQSIVNADFSAIEAFVLIAAAFTLVVYLLVDLVYFALDPRLRH